MAENNMEAGWYLDPHNPNQHLYWDGEKWVPGAVINAHSFSKDAVPPVEGNNEGVKAWNDGSFTINGKTPAQLGMTPKQAQRAVKLFWVFFGGILALTFTIIIIIAVGSIAAA